MELWARTSLILCVFGFLKEFRPSEPFLSHYLVGHWKNFTDAEVNQQIYPVSTYSYLVLLIIIFLVTDISRYKPVIVLEGVSGIVTWILLTWGTTVLAMQAVEFFYGLFMATEVAYYTYIYAQVDQKYYQRVTSHTRSAFLLGRALSGVVSQVLVTTSIMDYHQLNFLTLGGVGTATLWALWLPNVKHSLYFYRQDTAGVSVVPSRKYLAAASFLWKDFLEAFTNRYVIKWSLWWALATCGYLQGINYVQLLWESILHDNGQSSNKLWNGAIEALYTVIGAGAALACGWLHLNWQHVGEACLALGSFIQAGVLIVSAMSHNLWLAYACYVVFGVVYHTMITVSNAEVAKHIREDSYGLIFGVNTFFALVMQTVLTAIVVDVLALPPRSQFIVYGGYFGVLGAVFTVMAVISLCSNCRKKT